MVKTASIGALLLLSFVASCRKTSAVQGTPAKPSAGAASSAPRRDAVARASALLSAEQRRESRAVAPEDLSDRDVPVRRAAARALARIADARSAELLAKSLGDEDPEVLVWSAYGLGYACKDREEKTVRALVSRQASLLAGPTPGAPVRGLFDTTSAIADALGRCGGAEAERTLRAWLESEEGLARAAAFAFGTLAARGGKLEDASLVALLDAASRRTPRLGAAFQAFTRLSNLSDSVRARLLEVAEAALGDAAERAFAVRALASAGEPAATALERVLGTPSFTPAERADAARALGRLGDAGQAALARTLSALLREPEAVAERTLRSAEFGVLTSALGALKSPLSHPLPELARLADLPVPEERALRGRSITLRCRSAQLIAGGGSRSPKLAACDPDPKGPSGRLARLAVLDRGPLRGSRLREFRELANAEQAIVRERALELLAGHPEVGGAGALVARALGEKAPGPVATAARFAAEHPQRVSVEGATLAPDPEVSRALAAALDGWRSTPDIEVKSALLDAAGALQLLGSKRALEDDCGSENPTLRLHAEKGLRLLGERGRRCESARAAASPPEELGRLAASPIRLEITSDAGPLELTLDPRLAPVAVTRIAELARAGFYDGVLIHRVVPGFVAQLGDPGGDGYGGAPRPPLRCETSPARFAVNSVGIALSGRDTGSSQFFVTLGDQPHLDGEYALIGQAGPGWERVAEGDVVQKIRVK
ncbi:MAG TPA: peptidylprolyl isomerase [Polyangiaceae bacterium]